MRVISEIHGFFRPPASPVSNHRGRLPGLLAVLVTAAALIAGCSVSIPPPDSSAERDVIEQGRQADQQIRRQFGIYEHEELDEYVSRVGDRLASESEWTSLPWQFQVLDSPAVNAFAVPGGYIYVTRGLLGHMNSEAELAGVLGHEIAHVTGRHAAEQQRRSSFANLGLLVGSVLAPEVAQVALGTGLAQSALQLLFLKYSRDQELEADRKGIRYAVAAGYDPSGIGAFFETLQALEEERDGPGVPGWASTHPQVDDRIEKGREQARQAIDETGADPSALAVERVRFLRSIDGIVFGDDPRQGYMDGADFLHPQLRFAISFPTGWQVDNGRRAVVALSSDQDAMIQLTLADADPGESAREYAARRLGEGDVRVIESGSTRTDGLRAYQVVFDARTNRGIYRLLGLWVWYDDNLYEILGISSRGNFRDYQRDFQRSLFSFRELTDPAALRVEPARLSVRRVPSRQDLETFVRQQDSSAELGTISLINGTTPGTMLPADSLLKIVVGGVSRADG